MLAINISALATFLYNNFTRQKRYDEIKRIQNEVQISGVHKYLKEELMLTDEQFIRFRDVGQDNFQRSREIAFLLDEKELNLLMNLPKKIQIVLN